MTEPQPPQDGFFAELRRRKVFRVLAAYGAAAFVVLQVADLTLAPLGAPDWVYRVVVVVTILGLPVALLLAWAYDVTDRGIERTSASSEVGANGFATVVPASHTAPGPRRRMAIAALAGIVVLAVGAAAFFWQRTAQPSQTSLAVLPFAVRGNPELGYLKEGMVDLLSRNLDGVAELRTVPPEVVLSMAGDDALADEGAASMATELGARMYVTGSVTQAGSRLRIVATVYETSDDGAAEPVASPSVVEGEPDSLLYLVDMLSGELLASTRKGHSARFAQTAALTTSSLAALKEYIGAERHLRNTRYDSAASAFQRALDIDSTFALAYYRLAVALASEQRFHLARGALERAAPHLARLSERDRALADAYGAAMRGDAEAAEAGYALLIERYPDDLEAIFQMGMTKYVFNAPRGRPMQEAATYFERVLDADPEFLCPI